MARPQYSPKVFYRVLHASFAEHEDELRSWLGQVRSAGAVGCIVTRSEAVRLVQSSRDYFVPPRSVLFVQAGERWDLVHRRDRRLDVLILLLIGQAAGEYVAHLLERYGRIVIDDQEAGIVRVASNWVGRHARGLVREDRDETWSEEGATKATVAAAELLIRLHAALDANAMALRRVFDTRGWEDRLSRFARYTLKELAQTLRRSPATLSRELRRRWKTAPRERLRAARLDLARSFLLSTGESVAAVASWCGYRSQASFSHAFRVAYGMTPLVYRRTHAPEEPRRTRAGGRATLPVKTSITRPFAYKVEGSHDERTSPEVAQVADWIGPYFRLIGGGTGDRVRNGRFALDLNFHFQVVSFVFTTSGEAEFRFGKRAIRLESGSLLVFRQPLRAELVSCGESVSWNHYWINIAGPHAERFYEQVVHRFGNHVITTRPRPLVATIDALSRPVRRETMLPPWQWHGLVYRFLVQWWRCLHETRPGRSAHLPAELAVPPMQIGHSMAKAAGAMGYSRSHFSRKLRRMWSQRPSSVLRGTNLQRAVEMLLKTDQSVAEVAHACDYRSVSAFILVFRRQYGATPGAYRRKQS